MLNLSGYFDMSLYHQILEYTKVRIKDTDKFVAPEAVTLAEQRYMDNSKIKELCEQAYGFELHEPVPTFVPFDIIDGLRDTKIVPISYNPINSTVVCVTLAEYKVLTPVLQNTNVQVINTTPNYYFLHYQRVYGVNSELSDISAKIIIENIISEAVQLGAADITISTTGKATQAYYNVRKKKVRSSRIFSAQYMDDIITYLCVSSPYDFTAYNPKYVDFSFSKEIRGRVLINRKYKGFVITIRLLQNDAFNNRLEELNLSSKCINFLRNSFMDNHVGLKIIAGSTMSGKNWTAMALLQEVAVKDTLKIVSIEIPVETELPGVEQIHCETPEEYRSNIETLIHQNPDIVYITEIRDSIGLSTVQMTNTGKIVISSVHANGVADTIVRLMDITGLSSDRIIQTLHSIVYQRLVRDEITDKVVPKERYIRLTKEIKFSLYGKSVGEIIKIVSELEDGDDLDDY